MNLIAGVANSIAGRSGYAVGAVLNVVGLVQLIRDAGLSWLVWVAIGGWVLFLSALFELIARVRADARREQPPEVGSDAWLIEKAGNMDAMMTGTRIYSNAHGVVKRSQLTWPDGSYGLFKAEAFDDESGAIDGYHATYEPTIGAKRVVRQPQVTRDPVTRQVVDRPNLVVEPLRRTGA